MHAQALEQELAERYAEMADSMEVHNNTAAAQLFRELADYGESRAGELIRQAQGMELPQVPPWEYQWLVSIDGTENGMQQLHYLMTTCEALRLALQIEQGTCDFYLRATEDASDSSVMSLAAEMLASKRKHLGLLQEWLRQELANHVPEPEDLDPPHMPE